MPEILPSTRKGFQAPYLAFIGSLVLLLLVMVGSVSAQKTKPVASGQWGGPNITLTAAATGVTIELNCGSARIPEQLRARRNGSFTAVGTMRRSGPGPIRVGHESQDQKVSFKGTVKGHHMKLVMADLASGDEIATFDLTLGGPSRLHRCY